jgi:hypothetical protein
MAEVDTHLLEEVTGDLKILLPTATEEHHQTSKTEVNTEEIVATIPKAAEEARITTLTIVTQTRTIVNIVKHQATQ